MDMGGWGLCQGSYIESYGTSVSSGEMPFEFLCLLHLSKYNVYSVPIVLNLELIHLQQLLFRKMDGESSNFMALTGPLPELSTWAATLPAELQKGLSNWRTYSL